MINVSKNFNNYNTEIISTKCFSKKLFPSEILPFSPSYIPLLYLSWKVQELKKCHAVPNHITRENCERHKVFIFFNDGSCGWVTKVKEKWWQDWKWPSCLELTGFLAQPTKIHVLYLLYEIHLPYPTWLPNKSQLSHGFCYFLLYSSVSHCFITDFSRVSAFCSNWLHKRERCYFFLLKVVIRRVLNKC